MKQFNVIPVDRLQEQEIQAKIDNLNKPKGSLGRLEELAMQVCLVQQTLEPSLAIPAICCWVVTTVLNVRVSASRPVRSRGSR